MSAAAGIRPAVAEDLPALTEIYNYYVRETPVTFDLEPYSVEGRRPWFDQFAPSGAYRLLVCEDDSGRVVGYASSMRFRVKAAYRTSVETSIYLELGAQGAGLGARLYTTLLEVLEAEKLHRVYGGVTLPNPASVALHRRLGFRSIGTYREVGFKLGRYWDVEWFERDLV